MKKTIFTFVTGLSLSLVVIFPADARKGYRPQQQQHQYYRQQQSQQQQYHRQQHYQQQQQTYRRQQYQSQQAQQQRYQRQQVPQQHYYRHQQYLRPQEQHYHRQQQQYRLKQTQQRHQHLTPQQRLQRQYHRNDEQEYKQRQVPRRTQRLAQAKDIGKGGRDTPVADSAVDRQAESYLLRHATFSSQRKARDYEQGKRPSYAPRESRIVAQAKDIGGANSAFIKVAPATTVQLQKKFKHAEAFGVTGNYSPANAKKFNQAIRDHLNAPGTKEISGTYRGNPVTFHTDPNTGLTVIQNPNGSFLSGWKLNPQQLHHVLKDGKL